MGILRSNISSKLIVGVGELPHLRSKVAVHFSVGILGSGNLDSMSFCSSFKKEMGLILLLLILKKKLRRKIK